MTTAARSILVFGAYLLALGLVLVLLSPGTLLRPFGAVDAAGALWTWSALRRG
jgi:hypothetical protein